MYAYAVSKHVVYTQTHTPTNTNTPQHKNPYNDRQ